MLSVRIVGFGYTREVWRTQKKRKKVWIKTFTFCWFFVCYLFLFIILFVYLYSNGRRGKGKAHFSTLSTLTRVVRLKYENQKLFIRPQDILQHHLYFNLLMRCIGRAMGSTVVVFSAPCSLRWWAYKYALICGPNADWVVKKASILNEFLILQFCKKIIELLWEKSSSMKRISLVRLEK